ncbi:MAG: MBL fold metallo-hydrolase [Chloroflexi bacterium]|nr:MBL fold metallo-hydrolase [Chloroflexota bacterium]
MEIIPGIHAIPDTHISRVYLIEDDELSLVDTGMPWSAERIIRYIRSIGRRPEEISRILLTHSHPDHIGGAPGILKHSGASVFAHQADSRQRHGNYRTLDYIGIFGPMEAALPFFHRTRLDCLVTEGDLIPIAGGIRALYTPGHTPGSVCYLLEREGLLFSGDTIFAGHGRVSRSLPFLGTDTAQYRQSVERLATMDFDILCGGHGEPLVGGASRALRILLQRKPNPPTWRELFLRRLPRHLLLHRGMSAEDYEID